MSDPLHKQIYSTATEPTDTIETVIKTTDTQLEIWTDCMIGGSDANKAYNLSYTLTFKGDFKTEAFEEAVDQLVQRHESLRATFSSDGIYMNIAKTLSTSCTKKDISSLTEKDNLIKSEIEEEVNTLFDLEKGPLFNIKLLKTSAVETVVILTHHHIIGDALSINIILEDLSTLYSALVNTVAPHLKKPERFSAYASTVDDLIEQEQLVQTEEFWLNNYKESVPVLDLPIDMQRPALRTYKSKRFDYPVDATLITALSQIAKSADCSLVTIMIIAYEIFLHKITGQNDIVFGFPVSGNARYDMKHLLGNCSNLLPLRTKINPSLTFTEYVKERSATVLKAKGHHQISFGYLLNNLAVARDPSRVPLVPATLTVDLYRDIENDYSFQGLTYKFKINPRAFSAFELYVHACICGNVPTFQCSYNSSLFTEDTIKAMMITFEDTIRKLINEQSKPIAAIIKEDNTAAYTTLNDTETAYPNLSLAAVLSSRAELNPTNIAIEYKDTAITYATLHTKVNQFAHYLAAQGVQPGDYIAVSYPRSPELVYAIMAIIQCGAAYLPLDHEYPILRVQYMMEDSEAKYLLTSEKLAVALPKSDNTILIEDAMQSLSTFPGTKLDLDVDPENVLYLLYTSGSTGKPKGAKITNKNVVNLLYALEKEPGITATDRVPFISTISFDIASFELFFPLFKGAVLVLPDHETSSDGRLFYEMLEKERISLIVATPTTYQMLLDSGWTKKLPIKIWCCGEPLPAKLAAELIKRSDELWTLYGPTEVTIFSSCKHIKDEQTIISVGGPIDNMQYYIVDEHLNLLPPNTVGEIAIGGDGVGKGYLGKPELTASKYLPNKFSDKPGAIMYLSGDIGKLLPSNEVMCLGRIDHQVKVRGHRIEIGEIEHVLTSTKGIKSAIVLAKNDILIAFVVVDYTYASEIDEIRAWREHLAAQLPAFMVPHVFHILDKMPRTLNDKVDRTTLLQYEGKLDTATNYTAPRTTEEQLVAEIWQTILKKDKIDIFSNFFEMGGHSIMAVNVMVAIEKQTGKRIPLSALFQHSTVEKLSKLLTIEKELTNDFLVPLKPKGTKTPLFIVHGSGLNILNFAHVINHFDDDQPVYGFQGIGPNGYDNWFESVEEMAAKYIEYIVAINPSGPYALSGFSFGGIVAFEIARQLEKQGKKVSLVAVLDTYVDSAYYYRTPLQKKMIRFYDRTYRRTDYLIQMFTSWKSFKLRVNSKTSYIQKKYFGPKNGLPEHEAVAMELFIEADQMVDKIVDRYHLLPQHIEVELFRAADDKTYKLDPSHLGWKKAALKGVNIHNIAGDHDCIVEPPNDKTLARMLQNLLDQKNAKS